jgi:hypothetical protein
VDILDCFFYFNPEAKWRQPSTLLAEQNFFKLAILNAERAVLSNFFQNLGLKPLIKKNKN